MFYKYLKFFILFSSLFFIFACEPAKIKSNVAEDLMSFSLYKDQVNEVLLRNKVSNFC